MLAPLGYLRRKLSQKKIQLNSSSENAIPDMQNPKINVSEPDNSKVDEDFSDDRKYLYPH